MASASQNVTESLKSIAQGNLKFTNSIYQILAKKEGNVFFSPISIEVILALTYMGARGNTAQQMAAGLHLPADDAVVKDGFHALMTSLKSDGKITLNIANKLFTEKTIKLKDEFVSVATKSFLADAENVDFAKKAEATRLTINKWVESKTNNRIKDLLAPGIVDANTKLVLVNAVYFKGNWLHKFKVKSTKKEPFFLTASETTQVDMMFISEDFRFASRQDLDCTVLELPYVSDKLSMVIFLPNKVDGLASLEAKLPSVDMPSLMTEMRPLEVQVWLPKFKLDLLTDLKPVLKEMGMVAMFDDTADLSGIADAALKVSEVVHKTFIEVNEEGTEAAAATGMGFMMLSLPMTEDFKADHPFVLYIVEKLNGAVLFVGRISQL